MAVNLEGNRKIKNIYWLIKKQVNQKNQFKNAAEMAIKSNQHFWSWNSYNFKMLIKVEEHRVLVGNISSFTEMGKIVKIRDLSTKIEEELSFFFLN